MNLEERLERVSRLASRLLDADGSLPPAEREELNALLKGDPDACERYLEIVECHALLLYQHGAGPEDCGDLLPEAQGAAPVQPASPRAAPRPAFRWSLPLAAGFVLLLAGSLWHRAAPGPPAAPEPLAAAEPQSNREWVAVIGQAVDAVWGEAGVRLGEGDALAAGPLALVSGAVQIEFFCGAAIVAEGPAELELVSPWLVEVRLGAIQVFVPEPAQGFTVLTPEFRAVDLGTEFFLSVDDSGESLVQVLEGEVRLDQADGSSLGLLSSGEGARSRGGRLKSLDEAPPPALSGRELLGRAAAGWESRHRGWAASFEALRTDPSALLLFDFEGHPAWSRQLDNRAVDGPGAAVVGARWTEGRWPGKGALEFKRITDRVRLHLPGEHEALTLAARIRVEGMDRWLSSLFLTDRFDEGQVHWQLSDEGEIILGVKSGDAPPNTFSPPLLRPEDLGRWIHLATTVDRASGRVAHYLDGELVTEERREGLPPLRLGDGEIGNWSPPEGYPHPIRSLNGRIDEFVVLSRAMSLEEIRGLSEAGR